VSPWSGPAGPVERTPDADELRRLHAYLARDGAVVTVDGDPVEVHAVVLVAEDGPEDRPLWRVAVDYSVPPLLGATRGDHPLPWADDTVEEYADDLAEHVGFWATEHVRRVRPLPPPDRDPVRRELPTREELWTLLLGQFSQTERLPTGFHGSWSDRALTVVITPEQWQELVIDTEIGCRADYGIDAARAGDGPGAAIDELHETLATMDDDERFVVFDGRALVGSVRAELPPRAGTAREREHARVMRRIAEARRRDPQAGFGWFAYSTDDPGHRDKFDAPERPDDPETSDEL
jgi:hypothetical protein